jgi:asparagine synthase (glutamine-hydrolysing)
MPGGFRLEIALRPDATPNDPDGVAGSPHFQSGRLALWSAEPLVHAGASTVFIGHLFRKGRPSSRVLGLGAAAAVDLLENRGRALLAGYWGGYLLVHVGRDGTVHVLRDPSGALPCYVRREPDRIILAGDICDLAEPRPGAIDYRELARILASGDARGRKTCLAGVEELIAGECLVVEDGKVSTECWWSPFGSVEYEGADHDELASRLRETIADCVGSWASCYSSILLGSSGGLDSSIIAAAAAPRAERLTGLTLVAPGADGDERRYSRVLAHALGMRLRDAAYELAHIDVERAVAPHLPWPVAPIFKQSIEAIHRQYEKELSVDAHFSGNGGDGIFFSVRSAVPFIDRLLADGPLPSLTTTLRDLSALTGADALTVLRHAWSRYRRRRGRHVPRFDRSGLDRALAAELEKEGATHPWLHPPIPVLPGKTVHAAYLMRTHKSIELYPRADAPPHVAPLHAQPIVELCLSIPTWMWIADGRNRAVARQAFENWLPPLIINRSGKGGPGDFHLLIYREHRDRLHAMLRNGAIAESGIFDPAILDEQEDPSWRGTARRHRILQFAAAESWARWWSGG